MTNVSTAGSVEARIETEIALHIEQNKLSKYDSKLVDFYMNKAAGGYNIDNIKNEIQHSVELLGISYSMTPLKAGASRNSISDIQGRVISIQEVSIMAMNKASREAKNLIEDIEDAFEDWNDKNDKDAKKKFLSGEFSSLIQDIKKTAENISKELIQVAKKFDGIVDDTGAVANSQELMLGAEVEERKKAEKEISTYHAEQAKLEKLVEGFQKAITRFSKLAADYGGRAATAESRAFLSGIIEVAVKAISTVASAFAMGKAGATLTAISNKIPQADAVSGVDSKEKEKSDKTEPELRTEEASLKQAIDKLESKIDTMVEEKEILEAKVKAEKDDDAAAGKVALDQVIMELEKNKSNIEDKKDELEVSKNSLEAIQLSLKEIGDTAKEIRNYEQDQASLLRKLQADALTKVEEYEREKIKQDAELVRLSVLLGHGKTVKNDLELTIKCLITSMKSLKKVQSIMLDVGYFFYNLAIFLDGVAEQAERMEGATSKVLSKDKIKKSFLTKVMRFFIEQNAQWLATQELTHRFSGAFQNGRAILNQTRGNYLSEQELKDYADIAAARIREISDKREEAFKTKILSIKEYQETLNKESVA